MKTLNAQADLSLRWAHMPFCWLRHEAAHIYVQSLEKEGWVFVMRLLTTGINMMQIIVYLL